MSLLLRKIIKIVLVGYILYAFLTGYVLFLVLTPKEITQAAPEWQDTTEQVVLLEDDIDAWQARVDMISDAEETIDIAFYSMQGGESVQLFYGKLLEAADRGVKIRFLIDGFSNRMLTDLGVVFLFHEHPNIEFKLYEPFRLSQPWHWNNRLHNKIIIADGQYSITGGRNVGDRFFTTTYEELGAVNDRDIFLLSNNQEDAVLTHQVSDYYEDLWSADQSQSIKNGDANWLERRLARGSQTKLMNNMNENQTGYTVKSSEYDWYKQAVEINKGYYISNSLDRGYKEPIIFNHLYHLTEGAEDIFLQSPYIIFDKHMRNELEEQNIPYENISLLTNGINATPNYMAFGGYQNQRNQIIASDADLYEYQSDLNSLHMKTMVFDEQISVVGTFNVDPRSAYLSTESMMILDSPELSQKILTVTKQNHAADIAKIEDPRDGKQASWFKTMVIWIIRPFAKLFESFI